jgi:hypothetical protein
MVILKPNAKAHPKISLVPPKEQCLRWISGAECAHLRLGIPMVPKPNLVPKPKWPGGKLFPMPPKGPPPMRLQLFPGPMPPAGPPPKRIWSGPSQLSRPTKHIWSGKQPTKPATKKPEGPPPKFRPRQDPLTAKWTVKRSKKPATEEASHQEVAEDRREGSRLPATEKYWREDAEDRWEDRWEDMSDNEKSDKSRSRLRTSDTPRHCKFKFGKFEDRWGGTSDNAKSDKSRSRSRTSDTPRPRSRSPSSLPGSEISTFTAPQATAFKSKTPVNAAARIPKAKSQMPGQAAKDKMFKILAAKWSRREMHKAAEFLSQNRRRLSKQLRAAQAQPSS